MSLHTTGSQQQSTTPSSRSKETQFRSGSLHPKWIGSCVPREILEKTYGDLQIVKPDIRRKKGYAEVYAKCSVTQKQKWVSLHNILNGKSTSFCGNGRRPTPNAVVLGKRYDGILQRCNQPSSRSFKNYGARGIECRFPSRMAFIVWVNENLPHKDYAGTHLDRIDNDGHYEPGNLQLSTPTENNDNRRTTLLVEGYTVNRLYKVTPYSKDTIRNILEQYPTITLDQIIQRAIDSTNGRCRNWKKMALWLSKNGYTTSLTVALDSAL